MIDATVVGGGPNGLAAAVTLARAGLEVVVYERAATVGGGARTLELTLPGFHHDVCSAVHPAALASPFFRAWRLTDRVPFIIPEVSYAHPFVGAPATLAFRDLDTTATELGVDGEAWRAIFGPLVRRVDAVTRFTGDNLLRIPPDPFAAAEYGARALEQGSRLWNARFRGERAPALLTGVAAHALGVHPSVATAGTALLLGTHAHAAGWGFPVGGSGAITDALAADLVAHGGQVIAEHEVTNLSELEPSRVTLLDTSTEFLARAAGSRLPRRYLHKLAMFRRGNGVAKVDFALSAPVPWHDERVRLAPTVHLGGTRGEIAGAEARVAAGAVPEHPYVLVTQPSVLDASRAPSGSHTLWAYMHVPAYSDFDPTELVVSALERYAPGFRDVILASSARSAVELERDNPNNVGGDMQGGAITVAQLIKRPVVSRSPWRTPVRGLYLCSSSTPPGPSVQGMNGWFAAREALADEFGIEATLDALAR